MSDGTEMSDTTVPPDTTVLLASDEDARRTIEHDLGRTLFVEAGAGTGKTTALVGRILEIVLTNDDAARRPLGQIAAITFTEAAAAELRERVRVEFEQALQEALDAGDHVRADRCQAALADADIAAIQTLHGFSQRLLSEYPVEVGIPPRVEVIDEVQSQLAFDRRWSEFLDQLYDDPEVEEFIARASILGVKLSGRELRNIASIFDDNWDRLLDIQIPKSGPAKIDFTPVHNAIANVLDLLPDCSDVDDKLCQNIRNQEGNFARLESARTDRERLRLVKVLSGAKFGKVGQRGKWVDVDSAREVCKALNEAAADLIATVANQTLTHLAARIAQFTVDSATQRSAEGVLEFHDLLVLAQRLLRISSEARQGLSERYRVLMLDEFQDTDPIQITLALLITDSISNSGLQWNDLDPEPGRLFMVGDPKQSIYRFRRADIALFLAARTKFADDGVALQRNFRTVEPVIAAINSLFTGLMSEDTEAQAKYAPLIANRTPADDVDHRPLVLGKGHGLKAGELRDLEAADVASVIAEIREQPAKWLIDDGDGGWREPKMSDITILLPTRTSMKQLSAALDAKSIPFRADTGTLVYETQEILDLLNALRAVDDPTDQIAVVAALRSALYACGYDDLLAYRDAGGRFEVHSRVPDSMADSIVAEGLEHLGKLERRKWWDEPSQLMMSLIDERYAMAMPARGRRPRDTWRRLRYVVDQARAFSESGGGDLRAYLAWTDMQGSDGSRVHEPMLAEPDDDAVQIMTIHGSKGLEFPITIVSGMTTLLGGRRGGSTVSWKSDGGLPEVKLKSDVQTALFDEQQELDEQMDQPERERLLYVALTRARDHLVVSRYHLLDTKGKAKKSHGATVFGWSSDEGADLVRVFESPESDESSTPVVQAAPDAGDAGDAVVVPSRSEWDKTRHRLLSNARTRSTISATALAQLVVDSNGEPADEPFVDEDDREPDDGPEAGGLPPRVFRRGRAGAAIGSAVHGVLQLLDLSDPSEDQLLELTEAQAWNESVPGELETIRSAVRSALEAPIVQSCRTNKHYKELYVAAPVGNITVEGYVDLLVDTPDGLVVVDYKTDSVRTEADIDKKLERYGLQGTAYALAIESATGLSVHDVQFVFTRSNGAIVRSVSNLEELRKSVLDAVGAPSA